MINRQTVWFAGFSCVLIIYTVYEKFKKLNSTYILSLLLSSSVASALIAFLVSVFYNSRQNKKKANASIKLIHEYAKTAQKNLKSWNSVSEQIKRDIDKGNPYGEPEQNYTPMIAEANFVVLSFDQVREICNHLKECQQKRLLSYYVAQTEVEAAIVQIINTDYFRSLTQQRKIMIWDKFNKIADALKTDTDALVKSLDKQETRRKIRSWLRQTEQ